LLSVKTVDGNDTDALDTDGKAIDALAIALLAAKTCCIASAFTVSLPLLMPPTEVGHHTASVIFSTTGGGQILSISAG
jgi:hypothetical protein